MKTNRRSASNAGAFNAGVLLMSWLGPEAVGDVGLWWLHHEPLLSRRRAYSSAVSNKPEGITCIGNA